MPTSTEPEGMPAWLPGDLPQDPPAGDPPPAETGTDIPAEIRADAPAEVLPPTPDEPAAPPAPAHEPVAEAQALESAPAAPDDDDDDDDEDDDDDDDDEDEDDEDDEDPDAVTATVTAALLSAFAAPAAAPDDDDEDDEHEEEDDEDDDYDDEDDDDEAEAEPDAEVMEAVFELANEDEAAGDGVAELLGGADTDPAAEVVVIIADESDEELLETEHPDVVIVTPVDLPHEVVDAEAYEAGEIEAVIEEEEVQQSGPAPRYDAAEAADEAAAELDALADGTLPEAEASEEPDEAPADVFIAAPAGATGAEMVSEPYPPATLAAGEDMPAPAPEPPAAVEAPPAAAKGRKRGKKAKADDKLPAVSPEVLAALGEAAERAPAEPAADFQAMTTPSLTDAGPLSTEALLEAVLFVADGAVPVARLAEALEVTPREIEAALTALAESYRHRGLSLQRFRDRVQLTTAPAAASQVERLLGLAAATPLSRAALEALAIIAYQQPVTRPQIEAVRGVNSDSVIKNLLSKGLVEEGGRAEGPGRPVLYSTTTEFMQHFGLASLSDLPPLSLPEPAPAAPTADELLKG